MTMEKFDNLIEVLRPHNVVGKVVLKHLCVVFLRCKDGTNHAYSLKTGMRVLQWR